MTKVQNRIPNGYIGQVRDAVKANSLVPPVEAVADWLKAKYGAWIEAELETTNYVIGDVVYWDKSADDFGGNFTITFDSPTHEDEFVRELGGTIIPLEAAE